MTKRRIAREPYRFWTPEEDAELTRLYSTTESAASIAARLGRTKGAVYQRVSALGLSRPLEAVAAMARDRSSRPDHGGRNTRFRPGNVPWTAGRKGYDAGGRSHETRFKAGTRSGRAAQLWKPIGHERIVGGYLQRKVTGTGNTPRDYRPVHHLNWESERGPIPAGYALACLSADKLNTDPANWEIVPRAELMRRNSIHNYPKEIAEAVQLRGALIRQINRRTKESSP